MTPDPLDRVTRMLQKAVSDVGDVEALPPQREAAVARLAEAVRRRAQLQRRKRAIYMFVAAAAAVLVVAGGAWMARRPDAAVAGGRDLGRVVDPTGGVTVLRDGHSEAIGQGSRVAEGAELRTPASSEARLDFDSGTRVTIGGSARVRLVEQSQRKRFSLEAGSFFATVAKLTAEERFVVATPDAEVEVRGTAFRVTIVPPNPACQNGSPTRLEVVEGVVVVRHGGVERRVAAGERWPDCNETASATPAPAAPAPTMATTASATRAVAPSPSTPPSMAQRAAPVAPVAPVAPEASSRLAEQNDLFEQAMRLKRGGDAPAAIAKLDRLLGSYPGGPLAESAAVERMRLLATSDRARAKVAAQDYLRRYPRGAGRAEAEALVTGGP